MDTWLRSKFALYTEALRAAPEQNLTGPAVTRHQKVAFSPRSVPFIKAPNSLNRSKSRPAHRSGNVSSLLPPSVLKHIQILSDVHVVVRNLNSAKQFF